MSKADEMFEELGYIYKQSIVKHQYSKSTFDEYYRYEINKENEHIIFDIENQTICFVGKNKGKNVGSRYENGIPLYKDMFVPAISRLELQAINEKCKELGWL